MSRGYRRRSTGALVVSDGVTLRATLKDSGDEPFLLANRLPGIPVIVDADRYRGGCLAEKQFSADVIILDDGFQHRRLARDLDLVLLDARRPFGNGWVLPAGQLREKLNGLQRANLILLTRAEKQKVNEMSKTAISKYTLAPSWTSVHRPISLIGSETVVDDPKVLNRKRVTIFCGIANPNGFRDTLLNLGVEIVYFHQFSDHHFYSSSDIRKITKSAIKTQTEFIVTTEKDWVKLPQPLPEGIPWRCLTIKLKVNESNLFINVLKSIIL